MNLKKTADAERTFGEVLKADPKNKFALLYLGQLAFGRQDYATAVNMLNRATLADPTFAQGWELLTQAYMYRGRAATGAAADADFLSAVRAADSLARVRNDARSALLQGQALIFAKQYVRAVTSLERAAASPQAPDETFYLLGYAHTQAKQLPQGHHRARTGRRQDAEQRRGLPPARLLLRVLEELRQGARRLRARPPARARGRLLQRVGRACPSVRKVKTVNR